VPTLSKEEGDDPIGMEVRGDEDEESFEDLTKITRARPNIMSTWPILPFALTWVHDAYQECRRGFRHSLPSDILYTKEEGQGTRPEAIWVQGAAITAVPVNLLVFVEFWSVWVVDVGLRISIQFYTSGEQISKY
jgi:hypothetical protein